MIEIVHAYSPGFGQARLDAVPRLMLEVERESQRRVERAEQQLERALVTRGLHRDPHDPEPVAERADARRELVEPAQPVARQLRRELETVRRLLGPPSELI